MTQKYTLIQEETKICQSLKLFVLLAICLPIVLTSFDYIILGMQCTFLLSAEDVSDKSACTNRIIKYICEIILWSSCYRYRVDFPPFVGLIPQFFSPTVFY
jgi:hypothetical protein